MWVLFGLTHHFVIVSRRFFRVHQSVCWVIPCLSCSGFDSSFVVIARCVCVGVVQPRSTPDEKKKTNPLQKARKDNITKKSRKTGKQQSQQKIRNKNSQKKTKSHNNHVRLTHTRDKHTIKDTENNPKQNVLKLSSGSLNHVTHNA